MSTALRMVAVGWAVVALAAQVGCKTSDAASGVRVAGPQVREAPPAAPSPERHKENDDGAPRISAKGKLAFEDAVKALEEQKKKKAIDYPLLEKRFRLASTADPNLGEAAYNLGVLAERQGRTKEAEQHYKEALARKPTLSQAAVNLAVLAQNQGDEKGAVAIYQDVLNNYPDDAQSRARLAEIYRRRGENERAVELARAALFRDPRTVQAYKTLMLVAYEQKQYSMTRLIALRATRLEDTDPQIPYTLGLISLAEKEPAKARVQFKKAIELRPDFLPARHELLRMAFAEENYQGAEEHLRRILQANGSNPEAMLNLGVAYKGMGQYDKAMAAYDGAQKLRSDMPELYLNRGAIIGLKGEPEKAITHFKQYLSLKPGAATDASHPVHQMIRDQETAIQKREDDKRALEEAKKVEEEAKKLEAAAAEEEKNKTDEERKKKEEELKKHQSEAKGKDAIKDGPKPEEKPAGPSEPAPEEKPKTAKPPTAPAPAPKKEPSSDEPKDAL